MRPPFFLPLSRIEGTIGLIDYRGQWHERQEKEK